jgi:predicted DNA-binding transcriptional regulator YafY
MIIVADTSPINYLVLIEQIDLGECKREGIRTSTVTFSAGETKLGCYHRLSILRNFSCITQAKNILSYRFSSLLRDIKLSPNQRLSGFIVFARAIDSARNDLAALFPRTSGAIKMRSTKMRRSERLGERLLALLDLLQTRRWAQKELMDYFGVDRKTIVSNIDALSQLGLSIPILEEREGRYLYYRLNGNYRTPQLTLQETATLLLAQEAIGASGLLAQQSPFGRQTRSLLKKARASLPSVLHERLDAIAKVYGAATAPAKNFAQHGATIELLVDAAIERRTVHMRYYTMASDETKERDFDPYAVYFDPDGATLKVIGWDHNRQWFTPFAIDHIRDLRSTNRRFVRRPFELRDHLETYCFNGIHGEPMTVRLRAYGVTARVFAERKFHRSQRKLASTPRTETAPESITIEMYVARGRGLERFILSWLPDIEVLAPVELRHRIAEVLARLWPFMLEFFAQNSWL